MARRNRGASPRQLDPVKTMVAQSVQHHLVTRGHAPDLPPKPDEVEDVEGHAISPTETMIRVKTTKTTRYFRVKISEMML
jgi:hypothetical protein